MKTTFQKIGHHWARLILFFIFCIFLLKFSISSCLSPVALRVPTIKHLLLITPRTSDSIRIAFGGGMSAFLEGNRKGAGCTVLPVLDIVFLYFSDSARANLHIAETGLLKPSHFLGAHNFLVPLFGALSSLGFFGLKLL